MFTLIFHRSLWLQQDFYRDVGRTPLGACFKKSIPDTGVRNTMGELEPFLPIMALNQRDEGKTSEIVNFTLDCVNRVNFSRHSSPASRLRHSERSEAMTKR